ncbi:MAG TPA: aldo/keto reductase [Spirochaetia bacterium]|nr:aldo/keto reductase [Spirochaetia bacterium]
MQTVRLGRTGLMVSRTSFGALPIQRVDFDTAKAILTRAVDAGITFIDTASGYSDSEEKIGYALGDRREEVFIATKCSGAKNRADVLAKVERSLERMKTDHVDVLQLHNPSELPDPNDPESTYAGLVEARDRGMTRSIGITNHTRSLAVEAVESGLYDTLQFPLSAISSADDFALAALCEKRDVGFIAMKALCGGLLSNARLAFAGLRPYENVVPIWGIQRMDELEEILALEADPPELTAELEAEIEREKAELAGGFCRACGYCLPCRVDINIPVAARIGLMVRRLPSGRFATPEFQAEMAKVEDCIDCGDCRTRCPYHLDPPALMKTHRRQYLEWLESA